MSLVSSITKVWAAKRILNLLSTDIKDTKAFKLGIVDHEGRQLIKQRNFSMEQKKAYGPFEKVIFYVRRILQRHGVVSLALALTYIESEKFSEFFELARMCEAEVNDPSPEPGKDDFDSIVLLLEDIEKEVLIDKSIAKMAEYYEDAPTTSTTGIAGPGGRNIFGNKPENEKKGQGQYYDPAEENKDDVE